MHASLNNEDTWHRNIKQARTRRGKAEYIEFSSSPHCKRQQWKGCFQGIQTENMKSTECASSQIGCLNKSHIIKLLLQSVVPMHTKHRQKWATAGHACHPQDKLYMSSADVRYPTCQCTEEVMGLPSCSVTTKPVKSSSKKQADWGGVLKEEDIKSQNSWLRQSSYSAKIQTHNLHSVRFRVEKGPTQAPCHSTVRLWKNRQEEAWPHKWEGKNGCEEKESEGHSGNE